MELTPETTIQDRYLITSLIDKGGMGEVYLARDILLGRKVAIKFLKTTEDKAKTKRFRQEAKIISSLNHPNILSVYDFGQHKDYHYIVSELLQGENLRKHVSLKDLTLDEALEIGIQTGNALTVAHGAGIVHRDIKPENIMILPDGYVKVLDFGLAKLAFTESNLTQNPNESTASLFQTEEGMIAGTVYYMSPEQLRGQLIDGRSDIWSLGIVLYELIAGRRPFTGNNNSDIIAAILERNVTPLTQINSNLPVEIELVIAKALSKNREDRFNTAADFVNALKKLKRTFKGQIELDLRDTAGQKKPENTIPVFSTASSQFNIHHSEHSEKTFTASWLKLRYLFLIILLAGFAGGFFLYFSDFFAEESRSEQRKIKRLTAAGNITNGVISPDGRFIAFVRNDNGRQSLWLRQVDEIAGTELIPPDFVNYSGITFSPDGNSIFFTLFAKSASGTLFRIPILGGTPQEIARNVDSAISFAPNGETFAFIRTITNEGLDQIIISGTENKGERILSQRKRPEFYSISTRESLDWSFDGKKIASPAGKKDSSNDYMQLVEIDAEKGTERLITDRKWFRIGRVVWAKNAQALLVTASDSASNPFQIVEVSYSNGKTANVTHDLSDYFNLSITDDFSRLLGVVFDKNSNIFLSPVESIEQAQQITSGGLDGIGGLGWTPDGKIVFVSMDSGNRDIWKMDSDGSNRQRLTFDESSEDFPVISSDGNYIIFVSSRTGTPQIWRMTLEGKDLKQLTNQADASFPQITPDGKSIIYSARSEGRWVLWKTSIDGGEAIQLTAEQTHWAAVSPDGKTIACLGQENVLEAPIKLVLVSAEDGKILNRFNLIGSVANPNIIPVLRWTPNNRAVAYISTNNGVSNIFLQPVKGGEPKKMTNFSADRIFYFDWSKDGRSIAFARGVLRNDLILIENF